MTESRLTEFERKTLDYALDLTDMLLQWAINARHTTAAERELAEIRQASLVDLREKLIGPAS